MIRVGLIEDDPVQATEISRLLLSADNLELVGSWDCTEAAMSPLLGLSPDIALVDIGLPGLSGVELVRTLSPSMPATEFMMLSVFDDAERLFDALAAGATGYLLKRTASVRLLEAIHELHWGGSPMSSAIARHVVERFQQRPRRAENAASLATPLTHREQEVLDLLAQGRLDKEIAMLLDIGLGTVRTHIRRIYEELHAHNRAEAVRRATGH